MKNKKFSFGVKNDVFSQSLGLWECESSFSLRNWKLVSWAWRSVIGRLQVTWAPPHPIHFFPLSHNRLTFESGALQETDQSQRRKKSDSFFNHRSFEASVCESLKFFHKSPSEKKIRNLAKKKLKIF